MKSYVINLKVRQDRRDYMSNIMSHYGWDFEFFEAYHGRSLNIDDLIKRGILDKSGTWMSLNTIGCSMSHLDIYDKLLASGDEACVVWEDDAVIYRSKRFFMKDFEMVPKDFSILLAGYLSELGPHNRWKRDYSVNSVCYKLPTHGVPPIGAQCYVISRQGAERMLEIGRPIKWPADGLWEMPHKWMRKKPFNFYALKNLVSPTQAFEELGSDLNFERDKVRRGARS